jgi:hypothetical protein
VFALRINDRHHCIGRNTQIAADPEAEQLPIEDARELGGFGVTATDQGDTVALGRADPFARSTSPLRPHRGREPRSEISCWLIFSGQARSGTALGFMALAAQ